MSQSERDRDVCIASAIISPLLIFILVYALLQLSTLGHTP